VKGGAESGTIGPPTAIANAAVDALWHLGVRNLALPLTPYSIWRTLRELGIAPEIEGSSAFWVDGPRQ
jgi:aerobic carbon-monoxide dehydrogenase large subunit